jgi:hypothetical protein
VDSFIDQSTYLCFVGLYLLPATFLHGQLYMTSSSLLCSWLLSVTIYGCNKLRSLLLLDVQCKTSPTLFRPSNAVAYKVIIFFNDNIQSTERDIEACKMTFFYSFHNLYHIWISQSDTISIRFI